MQGIMLGAVDTKSLHASRGNPHEGTASLEYNRYSGIAQDGHLAVVVGNRGTRQVSLQWALSSEDVVEQK